MKTTKKEMKKLLNDLGIALENDNRREQEKILSKLEKVLPFKNENEKNHWLEVLQSFKFWEDFEELTLKIINNKIVLYSKKQLEQIQALKELKKIFNKKGMRVYARVLKVSNTGMSRVIHFATIKNNQLYNIDGYISKICSLSFVEVGSCWGLRVYGCGVDMIFNTLYNVNSWAIRYGIIKISKNKTQHDLRYNGLVDSNYWSM